MRLYNQISEQNIQRIEALSEGNLKTNRNRTVRQGRGSYKN